MNGPVARVACMAIHGGNVLWTDAGPHFVVSACLAGLAVSSDARPACASDGAKLDHVLEGYEQFASFDPASLHLKMEALRTYA